MIPTSPKVSIIMPTYNRASYLVESVASILMQSYNNWELIIVDDGSDDNTEEVVSTIGDPRVQFIKAGRIGINGRIKNMGLSKASGELIAFLDSDDLWAPSKLEKQVGLLQQYPDAGFSLVGGYNFKKAGQPLDYFYKKREGLRKGSLFLSFFQSELPAFTQALMFRKECLGRTGFFTEQKAFSDADFIVTLALYFDGVILYEPLVYRRLHEENHSTPHWRRSYSEAIQLIHDFRSKLPSPVYRSALFRLYMNFGESCLKNGLRTNALGKFLQAWQQKPLSIQPVKKAGKSVLALFK